MFYRIALIAGLFSCSLYGDEVGAKVEENDNTASVSEQKKSAEMEGEAKTESKRKWTKRSKPGAPKARKAIHGKKVRALSPTGEIGMEEEEFEETDLEAEEGDPG